MLGHKEPAIAPLTDVSLEELVPADYFCRRLDQLQCGSPARRRRNSGGALKQAVARVQAQNPQA
jgi:hypothetical protein